MARKMNKKTRNVITGILVGVASVFAVVNFSDMPADEVGNFLLSTAIFFIGIVLLALLAVSLFKFLGWLKNRALGNDEQDSSHGREASQVSSSNGDRE